MKTKLAQSPLAITLAFLLLVTPGLRGQQPERTASCPSVPTTADCASEVRPPTTAELKDKWGIEIDSLRTSANGIMIDFRYKVLDATKAAALGNKEARPYLIDQASGRRLGVPNTPKAGPLRQTAELMKVGRVYFTLFSNPGRIVKPGSNVTVVIGEFRAENLTVQ